jgi:hypothetical protein
MCPCFASTLSAPTRKGFLTAYLHPNKTAQDPNMTATIAPLAITAAAVVLEATSVVFPSGGGAN